MMIKILPLMIISMSMTMPMIMSPLPLGTYILIMSVMMTIIMCPLTSTWLSMTIFLIYIGGLLVLFSYFLAIQPNQLMTITAFALTSMVAFFLILASTNKMFIPQSCMFNKTMMTMPYIMFNNNISFIIILALILLLILVVVVKITHSKSGPLRPFAT